MPKYNVWRSGSGRVNCWNPLPVFCGEYSAETFIDACILASEDLDKTLWKFIIKDGVLYIESDMVNQYGKALGLYGYFQTKSAAFRETVAHFSTPQLITDSVGNTISANVSISPDRIVIQNIL